MQLPNKLYSYQKSTLALLPKLLKELETGTKTVQELYLSLYPFLDEATDFLSAMDCLYALGKIETTDEGMVYLC